MTTIGVEYGSKKDEEENTKLLTLGDFRGDFMSDQEVMKRVDSIPEELWPKAFTALKMNQRLDLKMKDQQRKALNSNSSRKLFASPSPFP
jgi:hypothetical protein